MFATNATQKVKNLGVVNQLEEMEAPFAEVVAQIDTRTTDICRQMNGRIIPTEHLKNQRNTI
jgi:hypothetical protein